MRHLSSRGLLFIAEPNAQGLAPCKETPLTAKPQRLCIREGVPNPALACNLPNSEWNIQMMAAHPPVLISRNRCTDSSEILDVYDGQTLWKLHGAIIVTDRCESASLSARQSGRTSLSFSIQFGASGRN